MGSSRRRYNCRWNIDDDGSIFEDIDCVSHRDARSLKGCKKRCDANSECAGIEWIPLREGWSNGRLCCFLKNEIGDTEPAKNRVFCEPEF
ncbi:hypothetical protein CBR_g21268 [Chara braunii]|uniref:Apple domain-containing protein n=1 Tax=Chara braunii TaxID=69332 RepID=A0A388L199_CHABU|nr:hypothetical protein CBR_g21268 [Chara braunii]|eukprot:GBG76028.1 hypothetical protein CBR_g21268 [Chara braunii]